MKGTWGKRLFGRIWSEEPFRIFELTIVLGGITFTSKAEVLEDDFDHVPGLYKYTLDKLVEDLEKHVVEYLWSDV